MIFVGKGVTGGVHKLIHAFILEKPPVNIYLLIICFNVINARVVLYYKSLQQVNFGGYSRKFCQSLSSETKSSCQNAFKMHFLALPFPIFFFRGSIPQNPLRG